MAATRDRPLAAVLGVVLLAEALLFGLLLHPAELVPPTHHAIALLAATVPLWLVAVALVSRLDLGARAGQVVVLGAGAVFALVALIRPPSTSDDDYRYVWDAKVQLGGTDPYRYAPSAPQLARLRDSFLFGPPDHCLHAFAGGCTSINRPDVHTVYPPVAEAAFDAVRLVSFGGHGGHRPLQVAGLLGLLVVGWLLLRHDPTRPARAALWTWCPVTIVEYANNAHIDWLAVLLVAAALLVARTRWLVGALVGAAIAVKIYPALVLPSLVRRSWWIAVSAVVLVALVYVPHVLAVGTKVIGYLPGYLKEEQYTDGQRTALLAAILPHPADSVVAVLVVGVVAVWAWRRGSVDDPARSAVVVVGVTFLVVTPAYGWYAGLLLALVAITGAVEWLPVVLAASVAYLLHPNHTTIVYTVALPLVVLIALARWRWSHPTVAPAEVAPAAR